MKLKLEKYEKYFHIIFSRNSFNVTGYLRSTISMTIFAYSLGRVSVASFPSLERLTV